eukprot:GDKJ01008505.1.p1 GENE.GDKJ01008505.1~~GDKJ01008505.1.p1  ORF type:complete len:416 (+),score=96.78 GDKJ01008505.1:26-1249(+)
MRNSNSLDLLDVPKKVHEALAQHFKRFGKLREAARHVELGGDLETALQMYFNAAKYFSARASSVVVEGVNEASVEAENAIEDAIRLVGQAKNPKLTEIMEAFLLGDDDENSIACDAKMVYKLQIALEKLYEASVTAAVIAQQDQREGRYKEAHSLLVKTVKDLRSLGHVVSADIMSQLTVLHSYVLVKPTNAKGHHMRAAKLLLRVADKIDLFPMHTVVLLTSACIQCNKAKLGVSAVRIAAILMRPEYRSSVNDAYRKKIETIVRRPSDVEEDEEMSPCPNCHNPLKDSVLECPKCLCLSPACIASGMHLLPDDSTFCPACEFPARYTDFVEWLKQEGNDSACPMCQANIRPSELIKVPAKLLINFHMKKSGSLVSELNSNDAISGNKTIKRSGAKVLADAEEFNL